MFKTNSEVIKIEAKKIKPINTGVVFWSHDRGTAKLKFKLMKDNLPQPIPDGTTVPIRLTFSSPTAEGGIGKHDYLATIEDKIGGVVSITLQDNILGYQGIVHGSIYMDFPGDTSLDTAGRFSFEIQRSPIDETTPELEDYYFNGFSKVIDQVEKLIDDTNKRIDGLNTEIDKANGTLDRIEDEIKESAGMTEKFINSIDFGDYDYSGNPNLSAKLNASSFSSGSGGTVSDDGEQIVFTLDGTKLTKYKANTQTPLIHGKTYTISCEILLESDFVGDASNIKLQHSFLPGGYVVLQTTTRPSNTLGVWQKLQGTANINYGSGKPGQWYSVFTNIGGNTITGHMRLRNVKIEEGSTATPYQPNLLDAPYYLSKVALGENIAPNTNLPVTTANQLITEQKLISYLVKGETYTVTLEGTKPASQAFSVFIADVGNTNFGDMKPVEGLTDQWELTFTYNKDTQTSGVKLLRIYQRYSTLGSCTIKWVKIEKGGTRTPNIDRLRYKGIGVTKNSINKYLWEENTLLEKVYTNSTDFGTYDYSGNPNLLPKLDYSKLSKTNVNIQTPFPYVKDHGTYFEVDMGDSSESGTSRNVFIPLVTRLQKGKTYTISANIMISDEMNIAKCPMYYAVYRDRPTTTPETIRPLVLYPTNDNKGKFVRVSKTFTIPSNISDGDFAPFLQWYFPEDTVGKYYVGYDIKIEEGSTATPYQPNLLDAPYYLSKMALGENIADPTKTFPINSSANEIYKGNMTEELVIGQTYTITLKGTKPASQTFTAWNYWNINFGSLKPVEGLTDVWSLTFTPTKLEPGLPKDFRIFQMPKETIGAVKIDWLKIEKGDTRTPNISDYKYIGEKSIYSNDYKNINWDVTENYIDNKFNIMVDTVNPQAIGGTKNFLETPFVNGKKILVEEKPLPYEAWHSTGTEQTNIPNKARLIIGPVATTIGTKLNRSMKENPLTWNSGNWQATVNRDCTLLVEGLVRYQFGGSTAGQYGYITFYKDDAQTSSIGFAGGVGINGTSLQWKQGLHFGKIFNLKKGEYFNITFETQNGKKLDFSQINTLHIMEIES